MLEDAARSKDASGMPRVKDIAEIIAEASGTRMN
jgi:hypothetical protein